GLNLVLIWREQDKLAGMAPLIAPILEASTHPGAAKVRAMLAVAQDDFGAAAAALGDDPVPTTHDFTWLGELASLADTVAAAKLPSAARVYDLMAPLRGHVVTISAYACLGAVSHYLGLLAASLGRTDDAIRDLEEGLALNDHIGAVVWGVHSRYHLAALLLESD